MIRTGQQIFYLLALLSALTFGQTGYGIEAEWQLKRDRDGIQIYTGRVAGSKYKAAKGVISLDAPIGQIVAILRDTEACRDLSKLCKTSYEQEVVSETELFIYSLNDLPWPVANRDGIMHVLWVREPNGVVSMNANAVIGRFPVQKKTVRLTAGEISWQFKPTGADQYEVVSKTHIDPEGAVPAWITNRLLVDAPFEMLGNLRKLVEQGRHINSDFEFLSAP